MRTHAFVTKTLRLAAPTLLLGLSLALNQPVFAAEPTPTPSSPTPTPTPAPINVVSDSPGPILVNGIAADKLPVTVTPGSEVCVKNPIHFASEADRWTFT